MALTPVETIAAVRNRLVGTRGSGMRVGLVPTMGALHEGHRALTIRARHECDLVVVSIFVNPLQFDREDDLARYPRTLAADLEACAADGVDIVFAPSAAEMYPTPPRSIVEVSQLTEHLCGRHRPGHFRGVATVVTKLLQIVQPDRAYFGEKDAQQLAVVRRVVADLNIPVEIVGVPIVREADGLALSSRNALLTSEERAIAISLYAALREAQMQIQKGVRETALIKEAARSRIPDDPRLRLEYLDVVNPDTIQPVELIAGEVLVAGALWVGSTRLIDNTRCSAPVDT